MTDAPDKPAARRASGTRAAADQAIKQTARAARGGSTRIPDHPDRRRERFTLGRQNFARITAVEGIHLSHEMEQDFREFDRKGLSAEERRRAIVSKYGKKPA